MDLDWTTSSRSGNGPHANLHSYQSGQKVRSARMLEESDGEAVEGAHDLVYC